MMVLLVCIACITGMVGYVAGTRFGARTMAELLIKFYPTESQDILNESPSDIYDESEWTIRRLLLRARDKSKKEVL